ncbi:ferroptosis suppressor protein 1-like [Lytechinus variegatus]|uniref:ferroptosis suppressor protein 1-like n=1 Tax=Lytechinus variegatus TaxID=7654 RepID=UPI001BB1D5CF|nr:ferroptosis suppressor protein 1-like [Lytechinus variegatus]
MGSSSSINALQDKKVVVIGASYGGNAAAMPLRGKCKLIVIDTREAMHLSISSLRAVVEPEFTTKTLIPLKDVYGDCFRRGKVVQINPSEKTVSLEDGTKISYDYLIIATGSSNPFPGKITDDTSNQECHDLYKDAFEKVKAAQRITVIGGGASGVELAGEIATDFPKKDVTLIHSRDTLLETAVSLKLRNVVKKQLLDLKVNLVMGEKVLDLAQIPTDLSGGFREVKTDKGTVVPADLVFICIGMTVNKMAYDDSLASAMDERGALRVNPYFQVEGYEDIFAIGDCCTANLQKMANKAKAHGESIARNIPMKADGKAMKPYKSPGVVYAVSVGRNKGAIQLGNTVIGSWFVKRIKGKDMFASRLWSDVGLTVPKL